MIRSLRFLSFVVLLMTATFAAAKDYVLVEGNNRIEAFVPMNATFTAEKDCKVLIDALEVYEVVYEGVAYTHKYAAGSFHYEIDDVKAGGVISITSGFPMNTGNLKITVVATGERVPVEVVAVTPKHGSVLSWATTGMVSFNFNKDVAFNSVKMRVGNSLLDVDNVNISGSNVGVVIVEVLNKVLGNGMLNAGDKFAIVFEGLRDAADEENLYNGDGNLMVGFIAPAKQNNFVKASVGETQLTYFQANTYTFLSYYPKDEEDGVFVVEFDANVKSVSSITLTMGALDLSAQGKYHVSALPYTIEGNKVIIDARGTLRTLAVLFPAVIEEEIGEGGEENENIGSYDTEHLTITLTNVIDENGNAFLSNLPGSVGTFSFVMNYKEIIDEVSIEGDNKLSGDEVAGGETVSLWVNSEKLKFEAISVSYTVEKPNPADETAPFYEQKEVLVSEYEVVPDEFEGVIISFTMPDMDDAVAGMNVRVSLHNASSSDGMPHSLYIDLVAAKPLEDEIGSVSENKHSSKVYTLGGVEVNEKAATHGIIIKNGVKVLK